ncbi:MAG TPA: hypothetical protein VEI51_02325 [Methanomicrobiales archaeon]|nr:hypothetical protein [Methanomicrobiales archaeon]
MKRNTRIIVSGFLAWLIPFLVSIPLYPQGQPVLDLQVTKSILIVVGGLVGAFLALWYLREVKIGFTREGAVLGTAWFAINCALDILVLVMLMHGMDLASWAGQIGIRYLLMPIMTTAMGAAADITAKR